CLYFRPPCADKSKNRMLLASRKVEPVTVPKHDSLLAFRVRMALLSMVLLIPCFWQRRIQAGDLASHIYNSWLAQQIELGNTPGLVIAPVFTNVLFDLILGGLFRIAGPDAAQRVAVSIAALIFFWGA